MHALHWRGTVSPPTKAAGAGRSSGRLSAGEEMSEMEGAAIGGAGSASVAAAPRNALIDAPILSTLLSLAWPNVIALSAGTCVVIAETSYIGRLGIEALAAVALGFSLVILTMTMSGGAMGGGVASAIARALGAGDRDRASALATHALLIAICFGL